MFPLWLYVLCFARFEVNIRVWFPLDRDGVVKSCDPSMFKRTAQRFVRIYDKNFFGCKSEEVSLRFLFSIVINLSTIS